MNEITYWQIEFTGIDGKPHTLTDGFGIQKFTDKEAADEWAAEMLAWQAPKVVQMWDMV